MMSNNLSQPRSVKNVWRNVAVAVFAAVFALIGLGVTLFPSRAANDEPFLITDPVYIGTAELGEYPQTYVGEALNNTLKTLDDNAKTGKTYTSTVLGKEIAWDEYVYQNERYVKVDGSLVDQMNRIPTFSDGTAIVTGAIYFFRVEPLVWDIFQQSEKMVAVLHNVIGRINFNALSGGYSSWQDSYLRSFLNQRLLLEAGIENYAAVRKYYSSTPESDTAGDLLTDQCWLPSYLEYPKFYPTDAARLKLSSDYALASGDNLDSKKYSFVVLRTVSGQKTLCKVNSDGVMYSTIAQKDYIEGFPAAFVLNETAIETILPTVLPAITVTYNGTDQQIANMTDKPDWYNDGMQITYTKDGETVTTVKDAGEYTVNVQWGDITRTTTLTVAPREITTEGAVTADNRVYDRTQNVTLNTAAVKLKNVVAGDDVKLVIDGTFADKNVGNDKPVTITTTMTGDDIKNYVLLDPHFTATANIIPQTVTITNVMVKDKAYDGTTLAILDTSDITYTGRVAGDDLTVLASGTYAQVTKGNGLTVTLDYLLDGVDAGNYIVAESSPKTATGNIKPRVITVTISDQTVKVDTPQPTLTAKISSGSLASGDTADKVYTLSIVTDAEIDPDHLPVGEYAIKGAVATDPVAQNYDITFVDGKYTVLTAEAWDALQTKKENDDNNFWLITIIVLAVAAFIGALVGIGLVVRSHDKNRAPKPQKEKKNKDKKLTPTDAGDKVDNH